MNSADDAARGEEIHERVRYSVDGAVAHIELDRAEKLNAIDSTMRDMLSKALDNFAADDQAKVALLSGRGRAFSVGADFSVNAPSLYAEDPWEMRQRIRKLAELFLALWDCPKPVIGVVHGYCFGAGVQLAACCDVTLIANDCRVGWPRVPLGGGFISPLFAWFVGPKRAKEMSFVAGSEISGALSADWGFANRALPADDLEGYASHFARDVAKMPSSILQLKKAALNRQFDQLGFREAVLAGVEWDVISHHDPAIVAMKAHVREHGLKATIDTYGGQV